MPTLAQRKKAKRDALVARLQSIAMVIGSLIFKVGALLIGLYYMLIGKDKKVKKLRYNPGQILNNPECVQVRRIPLYCIRHAESTWNEVFNIKASSIGAWMFQFPLKLCEMIITELILLITPDSVILDSPLSEIGITQALSLACAIENAGGFTDDGSMMKLSSSLSGTGARSSIDRDLSSPSAAGAEESIVDATATSDESSDLSILRPAATAPSRGTGMKEWLASRPSPVIYCSPLRRCLETMVIALFDLVQMSYMTRDSRDEKPKKIIVHSSLQELTTNFDGVSLTGFAPKSMPPLSESWAMLCEAFQNRGQQSEDQGSLMMKFPKQWIKKASYLGKLKNWQELLNERIQFDVSGVDGFKSKQKRGDSRILNFVRFLSENHPSTEIDSLVSEGTAAPPAVIVGHSLWILSLFKLFLPRQARHICRTRKIDNCAVVRCDLIVFRESESAKEERFCIDPESIEFIHGGVTRALRRPSVVLQSVQSQILNFTGKQE